MKKIQARWINDKGCRRAACSASAPNIVTSVSSIKKNPYHNDEELQQNLQQSSSSSRQLAYIKPSWRVTISSWSARPFFSCVVLWSHFTSCGWMPDTDVVWRSQSVDKSTVNRDSSVAEASFNLKLDLISQMHIVWNCGQCITRLGNNL